MIPLTPSQAQAVRARGNVLVVAGAGAGKTRTLVERALERVLDPANPVPLDRVLMVTFTEAAAREMRQRIRQRLEAEVRQHPDDRRLAEQVALVDVAHICTLHSFCLELVQAHFHDLALDPQVMVLESAQAETVAAETLEVLLRAHYAGQGPADEAVRQLVLSLGGAQDQLVRRLVRRLQAYAQALPDPAAWWAAQRRHLEAAEPGLWRPWLREGLAAWRTEWLPPLEALGADNPRARQCHDALGLATGGDPGQWTAALRQLRAADADWPHGKKGAWRRPLERLFAEAQFLGSLLEPAAPDPASQAAATADPLQEDWDWTRPHLRALLELALAFDRRFTQAKRELGALDFQDLEQLSLELLWDRRRRRPTPTALEWRARLALVFVDEYQDINAAQDCLLQALGREGPDANRFLVGDLKQSIYRFRLADPAIFQAYARAWQAEPGLGRVITLADNFRSAPPLLDFVNTVFDALMRAGVGGVTYGPEVWLRAASGAPRAGGNASAQAGPARVELHLCLAPGRGGASASATDASLDEGAELSSVEREARVIAERLTALRAEGYPVWDATLGADRPVTWGDMAILLRAPRQKTESYAKVFARRGVPLQAARPGLFQATEVSDLLSLLQILDNPLQDLPLLAVLRSPLAGLSVNELAVLRLRTRKGPLWAALRGFHRSGPTVTGASTNGPAAEPPASLWQEGSASPAGGMEGEAASGDLAGAPDEEWSLLIAAAWRKVDVFLRRYDGWREQARQTALAECLETVLDETYYEEWLRAGERGPERCANVERLLALTREFDRFQRQGLYRFLCFVEAQQAVEFDPEPASAEGRDAVRLMSIHQSKGLEFPVVVVADLAKPFNLDDLRSPIILDEVYGLCPLVKPPELETSYPSLPYWLAARRQKSEILGEELRLLYVALTRAADWLLLVGTAAEETLDHRWPEPRPDWPTAPDLLAARSYLDWLGPLAVRLAQAPEGGAPWGNSPEGRCGHLAWKRHAVEAPPEVRSEEAPLPPPPVEWAGIQGETLSRCLAWRYSAPAATRQTAKTSVTALRRRVREDTDEEAGEWLALAGRRGSVHRPESIPGGTAAAGLARPVPGGSLGPAEIGVACHRFLQFVSLDEVESEGRLRVELARLEREGLFTPLEAAALDLPAIAAFWASELGERVRTQGAHVRRELPFTLRLSPADLAGLGAPVAPGLGADEFLVVQGVVDLAVVLPDSLWLLDFKTDRFPSVELAERVRSYSPQLALYAHALSRIYRRPVTEAWLHFLALNRSTQLF